MKKNKKITVLIPCYNEEEGIRGVISSFPKEKLSQQGFDLEILVIDNNSTDKTVERAQELGVTVLREPKQGKGNAMRLGFNSISEDTDYVVMLDGDDTYRPEEILRMIEPLDSGFCDVVLGSRLGGRISEGSMNKLNRAGNWFFTHLLRLFYRENVTDVLTGYFAWKYDAIKKLRPHLKSPGFAIEMEMVTKMARLGLEVYSVPISYHAREGESTLHPVWDGSRILAMLLKNLFWKPKLQRIAFVSDAVMPWNKGGKERRLWEISRRLVGEGREVHIYTMQWWDGPRDIVRDGVHYHAICKLYPLYAGEHRSIKQALLFSLAVYKLFFARFDVLDVDHMPPFVLFTARMVTWLRGKKLYATWHEVWGKEYWLQYMGTRSGYIGAAVEYMSLRLPDVIISNSEHTSAALRRAGVGAEIRTITLGADLAGIFAAKPANAKSDIIYVGRLMDHKGVDLLVGAIAIVKEQKPDIQALVVGTGPERMNLENLIRELGLEENITMVDAVEKHEDLYGLMKSSKMLVLPSVREGFGLVVVEANAAGIPAITTSHEHNAAKDLIFENINGYLVEPTVEDIAQKIFQVLENGSDLKPKQEIGRFDWQKIVKQVESAFA